MKNYFRNILILCFIFPLSALFFYADAQPYFQKTYGGSAADKGNCVQMTASGGFIITGETNSFGIGNTDIYLLRLNGAGDTIWIKTYGGTGTDVGNEVHETGDGGFIITGQTNSFGAGNMDLFLIKTNSTGDIVWAKTYGGLNDDYGYSVRQTSDNGYIATGYTQNFGNGSADVYLIKTNSSGDTSWTKTIQGAASDYGRTVLQTNDDGFVIAGYTNSFGAGGNDALLIKTNTNGDTTWTKTFGGTLNEFIYGIDETSDSGFVFTGSTNSFGPAGTNTNIYMVKTNKNGIIQFSKVYGGGTSPLDPGTDLSYSIIQNSTGGYAIAGNTDGFGGSFQNCILLLTNGTGTVLGNMTTYGGSSANSYYRSIQQTSSGGYAMVGNTESFGAGSSDIYFVKTNSSGDSSNTCGTGGVVPTTTTPATIVSSTTAGTGKGATVSNAAFITNGTATQSTKLPLGVLINVTGVSCFGDADGVAIATVAAGSPPYTYLWSFGPDTGSVSDSLPGGTYALSVIDTWGCTQTDSFTIVEPGLLALQINIDTAVVCGSGDSNGVATVKVTGGTAPYDYSWSTGDFTLNSPDTFNTINGLKEGTYMVTVTDNNGCSASDTVAFGFILSTGAINASTCFMGNGSAWVIVSGGTLPLTYLWNDPANQTNDTATALLAGTYTVTVTDSLGCQDTAIALVNNSVGAPVVTVDSVKNVSCTGNSNGAVYVSVTESPSNPPYTFLWNDPGVQTNAAATGLNPGTYTVTVTNNFGCTGYASATVIGPFIPLTSVITDSSDVNCNGAGDGTATVSVSGGTTPYSYSWSPSGGSGAIATGLSANSYTVLVTDASGCTTNSSVTISEPGPLVLSTDTNSESCGGGDGKAWVITSGGTGPYTYNWNDPLTQTTDTAFNLTAGNYSVTVTDNNACSGTASTTIIQIGNPPVILTDSTVAVSCNGGSNGAIYLSVSGGLSPYIFSWSPGAQTTEDITGIPAGTHTVTVVDNTGCTATGIITIGQPAALNISLAGINISCNGANDGSATVTAGNGTSPYTYLWSTTATTSSISGLIAATYVVTVTDSCGAIRTDSVAIAEPAGITINTETVTNITCNGLGNGTITIVATGGINPLSYSINGGLTFPNTTGSFSNLGPGTYNIVVRDINLCSTTGSVLVVNEPPALVINSALSTDVTGCNGDTTGSITITASGGTGAISFSINNGLTYQASGSFTGLGGGSYTVVIQDSNGCSLTGSTLIINEPAGITITNETVSYISCNGASDGSIVITASGGTNPLSYSINGGITFANTSGIFTLLTQGSYDIAVKDSSGCTVTGSSFTLPNPSAITITSSTNTNILCKGASDGAITITASGGTGFLSYSIDSGSTFTNTTGNFNSLAAGTYNVAVRDSNGCTKLGSTLTITEPAAGITILSDSSVNVSGCSGDANGEIYITATGGTGSLNYSIDGGTNFTNATGSFTGLAAGTYNLAVKDGNACIATGNTIFLSEPSAVSITASSADPTLGNCDGSASSLVTGGTPPYSYLWNDPSAQTNAAATDLCGGTFILTVTDANGCADTINVVLTAPANKLFVPSAFSPDNDGHNEKFFVRGDLTSMSLVIYSRWGEKVFETTDKLKGWDGTFRDRPLISDSYGYYLTAVLPNGEKVIQKGDIILIR